MRASCVHVERGDAAGALGGERFDRVLVDPPCSGLGTLQSRPDLRWRTGPEAIAELSELQLRILRNGASALRPSGTLVYSVCTISRREGDKVIERILDERPELELELAIQLTPDRDGTDGFFIARLRRDGR
jgi:16S rRNA (cytosine967-C5)-methyltransferase